MPSIQFQMRQNVCVSEENSTTNYDSLGVLRVGDGSATSTNRWYTYLKPTHYIDSGQIPFNGFLSTVIPEGSTITKVELEMVLAAQAWAGETTAETRIRTAIESWNQSTLTFNNQPTLNPVSATFIRTSSDRSGYNVFDITSEDLITELESLVNGGWIFNGFRLSGPVVTPVARKNLTSYKRGEDVGIGWANVPKLTITYDDPIPPSTLRITDVSVDDITSESAKLEYVIPETGEGELASSYVVTEYPDSYLNDQISVWGILDGGDAPYELDCIIPSYGQPYVNIIIFANTHSPTDSVATGLRIDFRSLRSITGKGGEGFTSAISGGQRTYGSGGAGAAKATGGVFKDVTVSMPGDGGGPAGVVTGGAAVANRGGGGGGSAGATGGAGADGVAVVRYKTADAISSAYKTETDIFKPSIAFHNGKLFAPYNDLRSANIVTITEVNGTTISTTGGPFMFAAAPGYYFVLMNNSGDPTIEGVWYSPYVNIQPAGGHLMIPSEQFDSPPTISVGARLMILPQVGVQTIGDPYPYSAYLRTSRSALEMSTVEKSFMFITLVHEPLRSDEHFEVYYEIDGLTYENEGRKKSPTETVFDVYKKGFAIGMNVVMYSNHDRTIAPVIRAIHIAWDFVKDNIHEYHLACMRGADNGRWNFNPHEALQFVFKRSSDLLEFEDRFAGQYDGTIDEMELLQAGQSVEEGPSGILRIKVVEEE